MSLQLSGEATAEELDELKALLQQHPGLGLRLEMMRNMWSSKNEATADARQESFDKHLQRLSNHLSDPALKYETTDKEVMQAIVEELPPPLRSYRWLWAAASVAAAVVIVMLFVFKDSNNETAAPGKVAGNTVSTRPGSKSKIELPDGTQVWLNADSKLTYDPNLPGTFREVHLTGEAYFDVTKDKTRPFIIHTNSIDVKVLGTSFNVRSYPNEKTTETALIHGSVEITLHNNPDKKIILKPSEKLIVKNENAVIESTSKPIADAPLLTLDKIRFDKRDTSGSMETMWVRNKLAFENEDFEDMVAEIERWYNVTITVKNEKLNALHFTGIFENKSLADVMEALSFSIRFHYEIKDEKVTIW